MIHYHIILIIYYLIVMYLGKIYVSLLFMMSPMRGHAAREFTTTNTPSIIMGSGEVHIALP